MVQVRAQRNQKAGRSAAFGLRLDRPEGIAQRAWALIEQLAEGELASMAGLAIAQARFLARDERRKMDSEEKRRASIGDITLLDDRGATVPRDGRSRVRCWSSLGSICASLDDTAQSIFHYERYVAPASRA